MILVIDTETTGFVHGSLPDLHPRQPHLVELAAVLVDADNRTLGRVATVVRADGWPIPAATVAVHGISVARSRDEGIYEGTALRDLMVLAADARLLVAHNIEFDRSIVRIGLRRYLPAKVQPWLALPTTCTMLASRRACGRGKLAEAYQWLCAAEHVELAHQALGDAEACRSLYFELVRQEFVALPQAA